MKKKLESELISIAHRILKLTGKEDVNRMHAEVAALYEKLTVLKFAQENFEDDLPTIGNDSSFFGMLDTAFNNKISDNIEVENKVYVDLDERENDRIIEPVMSKIKDMVAFMPDETIVEDSIKTETKGQSKTIAFETISKDFANMPEFEPVETAQKHQVEIKVKSLNDRLKSGGLNIGLNDKIAFINHLFEGKSEDYDRVISQINTATSLQEAQDFVQKLVKPDYNNWEGKEEYEERFTQIIEAKFE
ncbi:hypothetical protein ACFQ1Q_05350 [Winogradskyella litorisediminis]|uniref:Uncharacterized protein n=1 Tax=Winogradskyella litorisediminis TaxID=1156618 RepID=A0ABW3N4R2_9FLAO